MENVDVTSLLNEDLRQLRGQFQAAGFDIRFVGGCVRDLLRGKTPKDVDLCTDASPAQQIEIFKKHNLRHIETGIEHGTITVVMSDVPFEITSLRIDAETDGRHAEVEFTQDWTKDLARRDFTINAMSLDFDGNLHDPFDGFKDLQEGIVRFVGNPDDRIQEDFLRIMRWVRFHARFKPNVDPVWGSEADLAFKTSKEAVSRLAPGLQKISRERIWQEFQKIVADGTRNVAIMLDIMRETGIGKHMDLPDIFAVGFDDSFRLLEMAARIEPNGVFEALNIDPNPVTIAVMIAESTKNSMSVDQLADAWKWSRQERQFALFLANHRSDNRDPKTLMVMTDVTKDWVMQLIAFKIVFAGFGCGAGPRRTPLTNATTIVRIAHEFARWDPPAFPVTGHDLVAAGMKPGPGFSHHLQEMKSAWAAGGFVASKEELMKDIRHDKG